MKNTIMVAVMAMLLIVSAVAATAAVDESKIMYSLETSCYAGTVTAYGYVIKDDLYLDSAPVQVYCIHEITDGNEEGFPFENPESLVTNTGYYSMTHTNTQDSEVCKAGDMVYIVLQDGDNVYTSATQEVTCNGGNSFDASRVYEPENEVPEFGVIAAAVALVGAVGLIFVSRRN